MEILNLISISKNYGGVKALSNINLTIEAGEIHSIIGENGAGKSTLMKIISGVVFPSEGQLYVNKQAISFKNTREAENHFYYSSRTYIFSRINYTRKYFYRKRINKFYRSY